MNTPPFFLPDWRSFKGLLSLQAQNAFNDKMAQFLIIPLAYWLTAEGGGEYGFMPHVLALLIVSPYLLLAPVAGWLSDRFSKVHVIRWSVGLQTVVFSLLLWAAHLESLWGMVGGFLFLSIQSTLLNPAKRGVIKELVGGRELGRASGFLEMSIILAVCLGQVAAGFWFAHELEQSGSGWDAVRVPLFVLTAATILPTVLSFIVKDTGVKTDTPWKGAYALGHIRQLQQLWKVRDIRLCALGKSFFWGYAGVLNLWQITVAKEVVELHGGEYSRVLSFIMLAASGGVVIGGVVASQLSCRRVELGLVPLGGLGMLLGITLLALFPVGSAGMYGAFIIAGFGGALFLVPLNGQLQQLAPSAQRGQILAGAAVLDCLMGLSAVAFQFLLQAGGVSLAGQCLLLGFILVGVLSYVMRILPHSFIRSVMRAALRLVYKVKVQGAGHIPQEGGVLLTPNHVSYVDSLILSMACPRPVRFLMIRDCFDTPFVGMFARFFDTIPISRERAKEAMVLASEALDEGTVVCIFPEGQLTRSGGLCEMKRGFELIARRAGCPVVPVYMDGLWGTLSSFEREKMFFKAPRRHPKGIRVHFGQALEGGSEINSQNLGVCMHALGHTAFLERSEFKDLRWIRKRLAEAELPRRIRRALQEKGEQDFMALLLNAFQLREMGVFRERSCYGVEEGAAGELVVALLAVVMKGRFWLFEDGSALNTRETGSCDFLFIGPRLRPHMSKLRGCLLMDVDGSPIPEGVADPMSYPFRTEGGLFLTCSMPHPKKIQPHDPLQPGWKVGSVGRLLPGGRTVPEGCDKEFFLFTQ